MANIMLTDACNLRCKYCFANEFVNHGSNEITLTNFRKAADFIAAAGDRSLGLIGGEPTLHSHFKEILQYLISDDRFERITLFTNGVLLDAYANELAHPKFRILLNCNSPADIGETAYKKMCGNLDLLIRGHYMGDRITLGVNLYETTFDFSYLLELLKAYDLHHVRMSLTVPNTEDKRIVAADDFFRQMKPGLLKFVCSMLENGILPHYDCNKLPVCMLTPEEIAEVVSRYERMDPALRRSRYTSDDSSIFSEESRCSPIVDIRQDLTAVRCFGLSACTKVSIADFKNVGDLRNYYLNTVDSYGAKLAASEGCAACYRQKTLKCTGGCLAYKIHDILRLKTYTEQFLQSEV